jgi:hypothetical protein
MAERPPYPPPGPTLSGIPRDVRDIITSRDPAILATTSRLSTRLRGETQPRIQRMCDELPTRREVSAYLRRQLDGGEPVTLALYYPARQAVDVITSDDSQRLGSFTVRVNARTGIEYVHVRYRHDESEREADAWGQVQDALLETLKDGTYDGMLDPVTTLAVMRARVGCNTSPDYGVRTVTAYVDVVAHPLLTYLVGEREAGRLFRPLEPAVERDVRNRGNAVWKPTDHQDYLTYHNRTVELALLGRVWANPGRYEDIPEGYPGGDVTADYRSRDTVPGDPSWLYVNAAMEVGNLLSSWTHGVLGEAEDEDSIAEDDEDDDEVEEEAAEPEDEEEVAGDDEDGVGEYEEDVGLEE